jgi:hypothetical protein
VNWPTAPFSYFHEAVVTRGIRSFSGILDSSIEILESFPGFSLCSTEWALGNQQDARVQRGAKAARGKRRGRGDAQDGRDVDVAAKVAREITEVGALFDDGAHRDRLGPPILRSRVGRRCSRGVSKREKAKTEAGAGGRTGLAMAS